MVILTAQDRQAERANVPREEVEVNGEAASCVDRGKYLRHPGGDVGASTSADPPPAFGFVAVTPSPQQAQQLVVRLAEN